MPALPQRDEIARGLSPLKPSASAAQAARLLLTQVEKCLRRRETFALASTLSGKTYIRLFRRTRQLGYEIELHYLWLSSPAHAIARVRQRVKLGGHDVPVADIRRRFKRSLVHLVDDYLPLAHRGWKITSGLKAAWGDARAEPQVHAPHKAIQACKAETSLKRFLNPNAPKSKFQNPTTHRFGPTGLKGVLLR